MKIKFLFVILLLIPLSACSLQNKNDVSAITHFPSLHADSPFESPTIVNSDNNNDIQIVTIACYSKPPANLEIETGFLTTKNWTNTVTFKVLITGETNDAGTSITFDKEKDVSIFKNAVTTAERLSGIVDVANPPYSFSIGDETYSLWLSEHYSGSIMNMDDTHTLYTLTEDAKEQLLALIP